MSICDPGKVRLGLTANRNRRVGFESVKSVTGMEIQIAAEDMTELEGLYRSADIMQRMNGTVWNLLTRNPNNIVLCLVTINMHHCDMIRLLMIGTMPCLRLATNLRTY